MKNKTREVIILVIISIISSCLYDFLLSNVFNVYLAQSLDRKILVTLIISFIGLHTIFGFKKLYEYIIKYRYIISISCVLFFTILSYSGSSMGGIGRWILEEEKDNTILGSYRLIKSDEYGLETPFAISQYFNDFKFTNSLIRAETTDVFSVLHIPVFDFLSIGRIFNIGYMLLNLDMAFALYWNLKLFSLLLVSFELFMIITNKSKYTSLIGSIIITFSGAVQWIGISDILIFGQLIIILIDRFLITDKFKVKVICALAISVCFVSYIFTFYPPLIVSLGYVFLALAIWVILKNRKVYKINLKDILLILMVLLLISVFFLRYYSLSKNTISAISSTEYPGERIESGGKGVQYLFSYLYNFLLPFVETSDNFSFASIISVFPIPIMMALVYLYKKGKHAEFLFPMVLVTVLEIIYCISGFPDVISRLTLLNYSTVQMCAIGVALANVYIFMYMLTNTDEELFRMKDTATIVLITMCAVVFVQLPEVFAGRRYLYVISGMQCIFSFLLLNTSEVKYKKVFLTFITIFTLIGGLSVNPITKGTSIITKTDIAKKVREISNSDSEGIWISEDIDMVVSNYLVANGAKTLNSTNIYPNKEFYKTILGEEMLSEKSNIWNRFAHVKIVLNTENDVLLKDKDKVEVRITADKINDLNIKYIVSYNNIDELEKKGIDLNVLYEKRAKETVIIEGKEVNSIYIYEVVK